MKRFRRNSPFSLFSFQDIVTGLCGIVIFFVLVMLVDLVVRRDSQEQGQSHPVLELNDDTKDLKKEIEQLRNDLSHIRESVKKVIVATENKAAPELVARLRKKFTEKEREAVALLSQVEALRTKVALEKKVDAENRKTVKEMEETRRVLENKIAALKTVKGVTLIPERGEFKMPVYLVCGRGGVEVLRPLKKKTYRKWYPFLVWEEGVKNELSLLDHTTHTVIILVRPSGVSRMHKLMDIARSYGLSYGRDPLEEDVEVSLAKVEGDGL